MSAKHVLSTSLRRASYLGLGLIALALSCKPERKSGLLVYPSWTVQYADSSALFIGMSVVDTSTVWVAGTGGRVARTTDGGEKWTVTVVPGADSLQFRDVAAFSDSEAFVLSIGPGSQSRIYHTTDRGANWTLSFQNRDPHAFYDCFAFWDPRRGIAFSDSEDGEFTLIRTMDGGQTWQRIDPSKVPDARPGEGAFAASGTCITTRPGGLAWFGTGASAVDTRVLRTTDYGDTWEEAPTPIASPSTRAGIFSIAFRDDQHGVVVGGDDGHRDSLYDNVAVTSDGGATWKMAGRTKLPGAMFAVAYVPGARKPTLVTVCPHGSAYSSDEGRTWTRIDGQNYWTVGFAGVDAGWAAGQGRISRIHNGIR